MIRTKKKIKFREKMVSPPLIKIVIESPQKNLLIMVWKKLLMCGIEKVDGLLRKLSFRLLSHYICILSLLKHFININNEF